MHYLSSALTITLFTFMAGCAIDAADELVSTEASAVFASCSVGSWCVEPQPVTSAPLLHAVWAVSASDVFAVGDSGTILRRSPTAWTAMSSGTTNKLLGVWAASSSDVWAVGLAGTILRFNGTAWSAVTGITTLDLDAVWGSGPNDVWLVGLGTVLHWNGTVYSTSASFGGHLLAISGTGPNDVWVTGESTNLHHFTGGTWVSVNPMAGTSTFYTVLALSGGDVWCSDFTSTKETMQLTGGHWNARASTGIYKDLTAFSTTDIWGAGETSRIGHWNGTAWTVTTPLGSVGTLWSITSVPNHVWVVGDGGKIAHQPL